MGFIEDIRSICNSKPLAESVEDAFRCIFEASNTEIREAIRGGKREAESELVNYIPGGCGGMTVRQYLTENPWTADMQGVPREELEEYKDAFCTRGSDTEPSRDKTMAEELRDEISAKVLSFPDSSRGNAYLPGIVRIAIQDCMYSSPRQDNSTLKKLSAFIRILVSRYDLPNDCRGAMPGNPFDKYLNGCGWDSIEAEYGDQIRESLDEIRRGIDEHVPDATEVVHGGQYDIIRVHDFNEARQYRNLDCSRAPMCVARGRAAWDQHANNGSNAVYLCRRRDALDVPEVPGEDAPLDDYGLSAFYVIVDPDGDPVSITPRWNHAEGANDFSISPTLAANLVGIPFREAFPPDPHSAFDHHNMTAPPAGMRPPRPRPADRPYEHGWQDPATYIPRRMRQIEEREMNGRGGRMG